MCVSYLPVMCWTVCLHAHISQIQDNYNTSRVGDTSSSSKGLTAHTTGSMLASLQAAEPGRGWSSDPAPCHYLRQHRWWKWPCPCWLGAPTCRGARHRMGAQSLKQSHNTSISRYISFLSCQNTSMQRDPCKGHGLCSCQAC